VEAKAAGVILQPAWAHGAKILVPGMTEAVFLRQAIVLRPFHVVIATSKLSQLQQALEQLVYRQRPRVVNSTVLGHQKDLETWSYTIEKSFVHVDDDCSSLSNVTATTNDCRTAHKNPRHFDPRLSSGGEAVSTTSTSRMPKTLQEHGGAMKRFQGLRDLHGVLQIFGDIVRDDLRPDTYCFTIVIDTCAKLGKLCDAEAYWARMVSDGVAPNTITYNSMMNAYAKGQRPDKAESLYDEMLGAGLKATIVTYNVLINAYAQAGDFDNAERWFRNCKKAEMKINAETFAPFIDAYGQKGDIRNAEAWLNKKIASRMDLDKKDFGMLVNAFANGADPDGALQWHHRKRAAGHSIQVQDFTMLFKACGRARNKALACKIFRTQISEGIKPDHFNLVTFINTAGNDGTLLCHELGVDICQAKEEFDMIGEVFNYDANHLKRQTWKIDGYGTDGMNLDGLTRNDFKSSDGANESTA
jgi:pentatricopeptide repeat protein